MRSVENSVWQFLVQSVHSSRGSRVPKLGRTAPKKCVFRPLFANTNSLFPVPTALQISSIMDAEPDMEPSKPCVPVKSPKMMMQEDEEDEFAKPSGSKDDSKSSHSHRRRHHRRANKKARKHRLQSSSSQKKSPEKALSPKSQAAARRRVTHNLVLRPTMGPLLNAPRNSTQFIIDDHESLTGEGVYWGTRKKSRSSRQRGEDEKTERKPQPPSSNPDASNSASGDKLMEKEPPSVATTVCNTDDDDTFWAEYSERDFQSVYESAHREEVADWDRKKLIDEISTLERRQKELVAILARVDPEMYVQKLQSQLQAVQERNRVLKDQPMEEDHDDNSMSQGNVVVETNGKQVEENVDTNGKRQVGVDSNPSPDSTKE